MEKSEIMLSSSFTVGAKLKLDFEKLSKILETALVLKAVKNRNQRSYEILGREDRKVYNAIIEFDKEWIRYTFYYQRANALLYTINLKRFLAILAYVSEAYTVELSTMYIYLIEALQNSYPKANEIDKITFFRLYERVNSLNDMNLTLSHKIKDYFSTEIEDKKTIASYKLFCLQVLNNFSHRNSSDPSILAKNLGVDDALLTNITKMMHEKV